MTQNEWKLLIGRLDEIIELIRLQNGRLRSLEGFRKMIYGGVAVIVFGAGLVKILF